MSLWVCAHTGEVKVSQTCPNSLRPHGLHSLWNSLGQNTGVGSHSLLQRIFPTQGLNPGLPHSRWILYQLSRQGSMVLVNELLSDILGFLSCTVLGSPVISNHLVYSCSCLVNHGFIIIYSQTLTSSLWLFSCQVMSNFLWPHGL